MPKTIRKAFTLAALGFAPSTFAADKAMTVGVAIANLQAEPLEELKQSTEAYGREHGIAVVTVDADGDAATQVGQIEDLPARKIDCLIYVRAGATAGAVPVQAARAAGVPVVAVDRNAEDVPADTFIATDAAAASHTNGDWVCKRSGGRGRMAIIKGQLGTTPSYCCPPPSPPRTRWPASSGATRSHPLAGQT